MQFIALYKFYYQDLYAYGVSLGFNTEDVKDAIQEVYLKLYFNERLCIDEKKIKFYLLRSVRNQLIDWERTKKDTSSIEEEERSFKLSVSVEESFISDEEDLLLKKRVNRILDLLTDHQREIVYLHFIEEMPYEEIAVMLGGAILFFTTRTRVRFPTTSPPCFRDSIRRTSRRMEE